MCGDEWHLESNPCCLLLIFLTDIPKEDFSILIVLMMKINVSKYVLGQKYIFTVLFIVSSRYGSILDEW